MHALTGTLSALMALRWTLGSEKFLHVAWLILWYGECVSAYRIFTHIHLHATVHAMSTVQYFQIGNRV